ncbi:LCP family protein [Streptomyces millisiae]|uniref:LCP family protein n=1 Tax=Streptomyces millisiae TaxID=3075542 RepID=A0ABU2LVV5_9ACTN|nr:LCP family protein [Streptomyces sp. DSM 44918]MDT0321727.1 LCP family protein [Streptomyces sp. DSM 44918]
MPATTPRPARHRGFVSRWVLRLAAALAAMVLLTSGVGHAMVDSVAGAVRRVDPFQGLRDRPDAGRGLNILLIGTDSREGLTEEQRRRYHVGDVGCHCADAVMLLHLSESRDRMTVVSLPRDTYAKLPAHDLVLSEGHHEGHADKLNAALSHGGPPLMVRTVESLTGLRVDHYLEVDFGSFVRAVDEVGGVEVCSAEPLKDEHSGLDIPAGRTMLDGVGALSYVRARHLDGGSDVHRMERQQEFLAAFLDRAINDRVLFNPARLGGTVDALVDSVAADPGFGAEEMLELASLMREFDPANVEFGSVPLADDAREVEGLGSTVIWDRPESDRLFGALRLDEPVPALTDAGPAGAAPAPSRSQADC